MSDNIRADAGHPGASHSPTGNPMKDGVGAASWAKDRADRCDLTLAGAPRIQPMSVLGDSYHIHPSDPDPRGMHVVDAHGADVGVVSDIWVDQAEPQIRYLTVTLAGGGTALLPMGFAKVHKAHGHLKVQALLAAHFSEVPMPKAPDRITLLEEDKVVAYYAGGYRYAEPSRLEPFF